MALDEHRDYGDETGMVAASPERACGREDVHGAHEWLAASVDVARPGASGTMRVQCYGVVAAMVPDLDGGLVERGVPLSKAVYDFLTR